jgi:hypothetical protein
MELTDILKKSDFLNKQRQQLKDYSKKENELLDARDVLLNFIKATKKDQKELFSSTVVTNALSLFGLNAATFNIQSFQKSLSSELVSNRKEYFALRDQMLIHAQDFVFTFQDYKKKIPPEFLNTLNQSLELSLKLLTLKSKFPNPLTREEIQIAGRTASKGNQLVHKKLGTELKRSLKDFEKLLKKLPQKQSKKTTSLQSIINSIIVFFYNLLKKFSSLLKKQGRNNSSKKQAKNAPSIAPEPEFLRRETSRGKYPLSLSPKSAKPPASLKESKPSPLDKKPRPHP